MKKDDFITYLVLWGVLLSACVYLICTGGVFSIFAKESPPISPETEDIFLYEQLVAENEEQARKKQEDLENHVWEEQQTGSQGTEDNPIEMDEQGNTDGTLGKENGTGQENTAQSEAGQGGQSETQSGSDDDGTGSGEQTREILSNAVAQFSQPGSFLNEFFIVDPNTTLSASEVPAEELLGMDMRMQGDAGTPQILIYHTHATEGYIDSSDADPATTVVGVGDYLTELLTTNYGYHVLHVTEKYDLAEGVLERSRAYNYACDDLERILAENPSIEVIIDLHRDGVDENRHLVTEVDGKPTAQIMFFNGLCRTNESGELTSTPNAYIRENLAFSAQLEALGNTYYPDYVRGVYVKGYRYNLHFRPKSLLLEVGAQTNTLEEAKNAMIPFADILNKLLKGT